MQREHDRATKYGHHVQYCLLPGCCKDLDKMAELSPSKIACYLSSNQLSLCILCTLDRVVLLLKRGLRFGSPSLMFPAREADRNHGYEDFAEF